MFMDDQQPSDSSPENADQSLTTSQVTADRVVVAWAAMDLLVTLSIIFFALALFPAFQEGPEKELRYTGDESPATFALMLLIPVFAIVNGMRRGFLDQWVGKRYAGQLDQTALGFAGGVLVLTIGYVRYETINAVFFLPEVLIAVMLPTSLLIWMIHSAASKEERNAAEYWDYHGRPTGDLERQMVRTAARVWLCCSLAAAVLAVGLGARAQHAARERPPRTDQQAAPASHEERRSGQTL